MESIKVGNKDFGKKNFSQILKGVLIATSITLFCILVFAFIIKQFGISSSVIMPVNQVIKVISIFMGTYFALKHDAKHGLFKGMFIGLIYVCVAFALFSALSRSFSVSAGILSDALFSLAIGAISGIISVNARK